MFRTVLSHFLWITFLLISGCVRSANDSQVIAGSEQSEATQKLLERNKMFEKKIYSVADSVHVAIGYTVSANSMIIGDDGVIIVDPGNAPSFSQQVADEFAKITDKPIKAIIYTHSHTDHVGGASVFYRADQGIQVWARDNFNSEERRNHETTITSGARPSNTQGFDLLPEQKIGVGIAIPPAVRPAGSMMRDGQPAIRSASNKVMPTHTFTVDRQKIEIAGVKIELVKAPGETDDQLYVWLPQQSVLFAGDNFYQSWPNTYPLRGTARRSVRNWIASLSKMIAQRPVAVVGGHTTPITENALQVLTNYRDGLQWVYQKTIEGAKQYLSPDELIEYAALPPELAKLDYLQDYYGSVEGTVRDIYSQSLGWFDGNPLNLHREKPTIEAARIAKLAGGISNLKIQAKMAMSNGDALGAAKIANNILLLEPDNKEFNLLMADALATIGENSFNAPVRNYTLSSSNRYRNKAETSSK